MACNGLKMGSFYLFRHIFDQFLTHFLSNGAHFQRILVF